VLDPELVFLDRGTMRDLADVRLFPVRAGAWLIGAFGALALVVAAVGLYGVIAYSVSRRVREIGIRKALGAQSGQLVGMVLGEGMVLVAIGGVIGAVLAAGMARFLSSVLFVGPFDAVSFAIAFGVLGFVALVANAVPARRAARVDPMVALRSS
jgi:ABC-type antimicrobial peptide transport system permease subunit